MNVGRLTLYTREAGIGRLALSMEGPSKSDIQVEDLKQGTCDVSYICTQPGTCSSHAHTLCLSLCLSVCLSVVLSQYLSVLSCLTRCCTDDVSRVISEGSACDECLLSGNYLLSIKFNDQHITNSPFTVLVDGQQYTGHSRLLDTAGYQVSTCCL